MTCLVALRFDAGLSVRGLAEGAGVNRKTVTRAERTGRVSAESAKAIADFLSERLGRPVTGSEIVRPAESAGVTA